MDGGGGGGGGWTRYNWYHGTLKQEQEQICKRQMWVHVPFIARQALTKMCYSLVVTAQVLMGMDHLPTESDLVKLLVDLVAEKRPSLEAVLQHACLWNDMQRLDLLVGLSNCIEEMGKVCCCLHWSFSVSVFVRPCVCVYPCVL